MKNAEIKIGQKLYKYSTFYLMEYEVFGILEREDGIYYQIKCLSCQHGEKCEVLIKWNDNNKLKYVSMLNNCSEDDEKQYYWHTDEGKDFYCLSKKDALEKLLQRNIKLCEEQVNDLEKRIKDKKESILKYKEQLKGLE